jgi:hypothetical protein
MLAAEVLPTGSTARSKQQQKQSSGQLHLTPLWMNQMPRAPALRLTFHNINGMAGKPEYLLTLWNALHLDIQMWFNLAGWQQLTHTWAFQNTWGYSSSCIYRCGGVYGVLRISSLGSTWQG